jgi:fructose 1,6-bisphosphate aldolase/phosphatase
MQVTITAIKADIGSVAGHICPSRDVLRCVQEYVSEAGRRLLIDSYVSHTGDDIAILMTHTRGEGDEEVHKLAWEVFKAATEVAKSQGLYGAGQDLLRDAFSGNVRGLGPAVAEMEISERASESFWLFAADKTDPGAYNLPLYLAFADPMHCPGLLLNPRMSEGFRFVIMDVQHTEGDRIIELNAPEDLYRIAVLLRDPERYVVESIWSRASGQQAVAVATSRLHNIAGKYTGKDDPVMLVRVQMDFPAAGEVLAPFSIGPFVAGGMRGSHHIPLMPVTLNSGISYFDGPAIVSAAGFCVHQGRLTEPVDGFSQPMWNAVRDHLSHKAIEMRRQGFVGPAMLPVGELEYMGIKDTLGDLDARFVVRAEKLALAAR